MSETGASVAITMFDSGGEDFVRVLATDADGNDLDLVVALGMIELAKDALLHRDEFGEVVSDGATQS